MRNLAIAVVLLAAGSVATAQENSGKGEGDTAPPASGSWFTRLWSLGDKPEPKSAPSTVKKTEPLSAQAIAGRLTRENVILNRRNQVILKLREIAHATQDDELLRQADELEARAWEVYLQRTDNPDGSMRPGEGRQ